jgi:hypothetical protein
MIHIRQKDSTQGVYTIVNTTDWKLPLDQHPSIVEHPETFEIVDEELPSIYQILNYV